MGLTLQHSQVEAWEWLLVSITGEVPRVKWEVKRNTPEGLPQPLWLFPALCVNRNILPHDTAAGVFFLLNASMKLGFRVYLLGTSSPLRGGLVPLSHGLPISQQEPAPTCAASPGKALQSSRLPGFCYQPLGWLAPGVHLQGQQ